MLRIRIHAVRITIEFFNFRIEKLYLYRRDFLFYFFLMSEFIQRYKIWVQRTEPDRLENSNVKIIANGIKIILYRWHHQPRDWVNRFDRSDIKINKLSGYEFWEAHLFDTIIFRVLFCCSHLGRNVSVLACSSVFFFQKTWPPRQVVSYDSTVDANGCPRVLLLI